MLHQIARYLLLLLLLDVMILQNAPALVHAYSLYPYPAFLTLPAPSHARQGLPAHLNQNSSKLTMRTPYHVTCADTV
jgi:hypothetical protein